MSRKTIVSFTLLLSFLINLLCLSPAFAETEIGKKDEEGVYQTQMLPWKYSDYANDEKLDEYDEAYRETYTEANVHTPPQRGCYQQNKTANIAKDDETFYEPGDYRLDRNDVIDIIVDFDKEVSFQEMVYGSRTDGGNLKGFATEFNVYTSQSDEDDNQEWTKVAHGTGTQTSKLCSFDVCPEGETVKAHRVKFEFVSSYNNYPSCRCLRFYEEDLNEHKLEEIWSDYTETSFKQGTTDDDVRRLLQELKDSPSYEITYEPLIGRAQDVLDGKVHFDETLVRKNQPIGEAKVNSDDFLRIGDLAGYARNNMKFPNGGTNRQVTGIWYPSNTKAHIWVYRENESDPLPKISFAQPYGYWASWRADGVQLQPGENIITIPMRKTVDYKTYDIVAGMALYIENPYTEEQQTGDVKIYFEGGRQFPVYRLGDDIDAYMKELRAHADRVREDHLNEMDVTELVSGHVMMTVQATRADEIYGAKGHNAEDNLKEWDETIERCLQFEGIPMSAEEEAKYNVGDFSVKYDVKNKFLNENFRVSQVWDLGWMFTAGEHIGVYDDPSAQDVLIDCLDEYGKSNIGPNWGLIHEWGHSVDIPARSIQETTNNMAPYFESTFYPEFRRNEEDILRANRMALPKYENGTMQAENRYNFMPFWLVESYFPGWWGKLSNMYRLVPQTEDWGFYTENGKIVDKLTKSERMVIYSSIAAGYDLRYWFDKWGLQIDTSQAKFDKSQETEEFKKVWQAKCPAEKVKSTINGEFDVNSNPLPLWYEDRDQYLKVKGAESNPVNLQIYGKTDDQDAGKPQLLGIRHAKRSETKEQNGQKITTEYDTVNITVKKSQDPNHLCYIFQYRDKSQNQGTDNGWQNAGYTHGGVFTDYQSLTPNEYSKFEYRACAMDRSLHTSPWSEPITFVDETPVAEITKQDGTVQEFTTVAAAIDEAWEQKGEATQAEVRLIDNAFVAGINVSDGKNIVIKPKSESVSLGRSSGDYMFSVGNNSTLRLESNGSAVLTLDGYEADGINGGVVVQGNNARFEADHIIFQNFVNTASGAAGQGGAVRVPTSSAKAFITDCTFMHNSALDGGALASRGTVTIKNSSFDNNVAKDEGGAVRNHEGGIVYAVEDTFTNNTAVYGGGVSLEGFTVLATCEVANNSAKFGGGVDIRLNSTARAAVLTALPGKDATKIHDNVAQAGAAVNVGSSGDVFLGQVEMSSPDEKTSSLLASAGIIMANAGQADICEKYANVRNNSLKLYDNTNSKDIMADDVTTTINGYVTEKGSVYITENEHWTAGDTSFDVSDLGRAQPIVALRAFESNDEDVQSHIKLYGDASPLVEYKGPAEDAEASTDTIAGAYVHRGGQVIFNTDGGTIKEGNIDGYTSGVKTYLPTNVYKEGFTFVGWFDNAELQGESQRYVPETQNGDAVYWAKFSESAYWINYRPNGGAMPEGTKTHRSIIENVKLAEPVRATYTFLGWYPDNEFKKAEVTQIEAGTEGDTTIYAKYDHHKNGGEKKVIKPATCTEKGLEAIIYKCVDCDEPMETEFREIPAKGHSWNSWEKQTVQTCTGKEFSTRTCKNCGFAETNISATDLATQVHSWDAGQQAKAPTCTEEGATVYTCTVCQAKKSEPIPPLGHNFEGAEERRDERSEASCALPGVVDIYKTCTVCNQEFLVDTDDTDPLGHDWKTTEDYEQDAAEAEAEAQVQKRSFVPPTVPQTDSNGWHILAEATCETEAGEIRARTCDVCGFVETVQDDFDHRWDTKYTVDVPASCVSDGEESIHCLDCGAKKDIRTISVAGHNFDDTTSPTCANCEAKNPEYVDPDAGGEDVETLHEHTWSEDWAYDPAPTCTTPGVKYHYCTDTSCNERDAGEAVEALGHNFGVDNLDEVCSVCGAPNDTLPPAHEHTPGDWEETLTPNCKDAGLKVKKCTECGEELQSEPVPALGHTFVDGTCSVCGEKSDEPQNQEHEHTYSNEWTIDVEPTCTQDGLKSHHCTICQDEVDVTPIAALGHDFVETEKTCRREGCDVINEAYVEPHEHTPALEQVVELAPTCVSYGVNKIVCATCQDTIQEVATEPLDHDFGENSQEPYCTREGCDAKNPDETLPEGHVHQFADVATVDYEPTCDEQGEQSKHCYDWRCKESIDEEDIAPLGHSFVDFKCERCGAIEDTARFDLFEGANPNNVLPGGQVIYIHRIEPNKSLTITVPAEFSCETPTILGDASFVAKSQNEFEFTNSGEKLAYARICINIPEDADATKTYLVLDGEEDVPGLGTTSDEIRVVKTSEIEPDVIDVGGTAQLTFTFGAFTSKDLSALSKYFDIVGEPVLDASEGNYDIDDFVVVVHDEDLSLGRVTWNMKLKDNIVPGSYCARGSQGRTDGVDAMSVIDCPFTVVAPAQEPIPQDDPQEPSEGNSEPEKHTHDQVMAQYNLWYSEHELRLYKEDYKEVSWKAFEDVQDRFLSTVEDENHKCSEVAALFSSVKKAFDSLEPVSAEGGAIEALRQNVARAQELLENKQTTGNLPTLQAATDLASNLLSQGEILAPDVREAHVALAEALAGVSAPAPDAIDKEKLSSLVAEIEDMDLSGYTDVTVSALKSTLAEAKDAILAEDTTQQELDSLYEKLTSARDNLEFVEASENSSTHSEDLDAESEQNGAPVGDADSDVNASGGDSSVDGTQTQTADQNQNQNQNQSSSQNQNVTQNENHAQNQNSSANGENTIGASQDSQTTSKQVSTGSGTNSDYTATDTTVPLYNDGRSVTYSGNTNEGVVTQTANAQVQPKLADTGIIALVAPATVLGVGAGVAFVVRATKERKTK